MKIGIKYCGGCQSTYNRKETVELIKNDNLDHEFITVNDKEEYDLIIVVSGCHIKCANIKKYYSKYGFIFLDSPDYKFINEKLNKLQNSKK